MPFTLFKRGLRLAVTIAAGSLILGTVILVCAGLRDDVDPSDLCLVLGSKVEMDGTPSPRLRARLERTVELYRAKQFPMVLVSGGVGREGFDEAVVMKDYLVDNGVPKENVLVDSKGVNTYASARKTAEVLRSLQLRSVLVVSQYFHLPRARLALRRFGVSEVHTSHARFFEVRDLYSAPREAIGYLSYLVRSYD